ncbi:hypothetical protein AAMO2058_000302800 [Amorphochlora amoebiformis]
MTFWGSLGYSRKRMISRVGWRSMSSILNLRGDTYDLAAAIQADGLMRGYAVYDNKEQGVKVSSPGLEPLRKFLENDTVDFDKHEGMFFEVGLHTRALHGAFLASTVRGQGCGGIRLRKYNTVEEYIRDGMRLATGMGRKSALAGLWAGGGKGVIAEPPRVQVNDFRGTEREEAMPSIPEGGLEKYLGTDNVISDPFYRQILFQEYGDFLTSLRGCYVAAEDAGVFVSDVDVVFSRSRYTTCISVEKGGSGNPSVPTAAGIVSAMEGALAETGMGDLKGKKITIQGVGNVGRPMIRYLLEKGVSSIVAGDVDAVAVERARKEVGEVSEVDIRLITSSKESEDLWATECDILSPCAYGAVLNEESIQKINAKFVVGAANNQLKDPHTHGELLHDRKIIYVPDYVANRMGIVNCANEAYGRVGRLEHLEDPAITRHLDHEYEFGVYQTTRRVLRLAFDENIATNKAADRLADEALQQPHPIWGHRSQQIIDSLVEDQWHTCKSVAE